MKAPRASSLAIVAILIGATVFGLPITARPASAVSSSCTAATNPFNVIDVAWGTSGSTLSVYPGEQNVPLTISLDFSGPCTAAQTVFYLYLQNGTYVTPFTGPNGLTQLKDVAVNTGPNTLLAETFYLTVPQSAATGIIYTIPMAIQYVDSSTSNIFTQFTQAPIELYGPVQLSLTAATTHLTSGVADNVTITISNSGTGTSGPVSTTVAAPSGVVVLNQLAPTSSLAPGASASALLQLFVPSSMSGTAFDLTFTSKYLDAYSNSQSVTNTLGFLVSTTTTVTTSSSFLVEGANWGSASSTASALPGSQNEPLVVTLQYLGATAITSLQGTLLLPTGVTDLNGHGSATAFSSTSTNQYGSVTLTFNLDLASTVRPGNYNFTLVLSWMTSQSVGLTQSAIVTPPPITALQSSFIVESSVWQKAASSNSTSSSSAVSPEPGSTDVPLVISLQYVGTASITSLEGKLTLPAGITDLNGQTTATAYAATATPNQVITLTFNLDIESSVAPGSYSFPLDLSWTTNSVTLSQSTSLSPPPVAAPASTTTFQLTLAQTNSTMTVGQENSAGFKLTNGGASTIYSPTFSLLADNPVLLSSIGSAVPTDELAPGASTTFTAQLTSGPSATPGIYGGTLTVSFTDSSSVSHTQSFPISFTLEGTVILILQDTSVSQSLSGFTVTGSLLNEGSVAAYYASINGLLGTNSGTAVYLGEIDPNTPLPFSVTIPYTAPVTVNSTAASGNSTVSNSNATSFTVSRTRGTGSFTGVPPGGAGNFTRIIGNGDLHRLLRPGQRDVEERGGRLCAHRSHTDLQGHVREQPAPELRGDNDDKDRKPAGERGLEHPDHSLDRRQRPAGPRIRRGGCRRADGGGRRGASQEV